MKKKIVKSLLVLGIGLLCVSQSYFAEEITRSSQTIVEESNEEEILEKAETVDTTQPKPDQVESVESADTTASDVVPEKDQEGITKEPVTVTTQTTKSNFDVITSSVAVHYETILNQTTRNDGIYHKGPFSQCCQPNGNLQFINSVAILIE